MCDTDAETFGDRVLLLKGDYAVTINPSDKYQYFGKDGRLDAFMRYWALFFSHFHNIGYSLQVELSEPVTGSEKGEQLPRLHFHGVFRFCDNASIRDFLLEYAVSLSKTARYSIKPLDDPTKWDTYCHKQAHLGLPSLTTLSMAGATQVTPRTLSGTSKKKVDVSPLSGDHRDFGDDLTYVSSGTPDSQSVSPPECMKSFSVAKVYKKVRKCRRTLEDRTKD